MNGLLSKLYYESPTVTMTKDAGYDFILFDMEHGFFSLNDIHDSVLIAKAIQLYSYVRIPEITKETVSKALDLGVDGVLAPMVESRQEVEKLIAFGKYYPLGKRGYASGPNTLYRKATSYKSEMERANKETTLWIQIETKKALENVEDFIDCDGLEGVIIGPADLSISLGVPSDVMHETMNEAILYVIELAKKHNKKVGIIGSLELLERYSNKLDVFVQAIDMNIMRDGVKESYRKLSSIQK